MLFFGLRQRDERGGRLKRSGLSCSLRTKEILRRLFDTLLLRIDNIIDLFREIQSSAPVMLCLVPIVTCLNLLKLCTYLVR